VNHPDSESKGLFVTELPEADVAGGGNQAVAHGDSVGAIEGEADVRVATAQTTRFLQCIFGPAAVLGILDRWQRRGRLACHHHRWSEADPDRAQPYGLGEITA
jgi:hypothetical protein